MSKWVRLRRCFPARPRTIIMLCNRHSSSADPNGGCPFAGSYLSGNSSGRCQRPILVRMIVNRDNQRLPLTYSYVATTQPPPQVTLPAPHLQASRLSRDKASQDTLRARHARFNPQRTPSPLRIMPQVRAYAITYPNQLIYLFASSGLDGFKRDERPLPTRSTRDSRLWSHDPAWFTSKYLPDSFISTVSPCSINVRVS